MALKQALTFNTAGKVGTVSNSYIISKKQYDNPVATEANSIKECFNQVTFWLNRYSTDYTYAQLTPFSEMLLLDAPDAYLRNGFLIRKMGKIYPFATPEYPAVGQTIAPTRQHIPTLFEDMTGKEMLKMSAGVDFRKYQNKDVFMDVSAYEDYFLRHATLVADSFARGVNAVSSILATAPFGWTMTKDVDIAPFFDSNALPDADESKPANEYFKNDSFIFKWIKEEVVGQIQSKFTNKIYYSPELYSPYSEQVEFEKPAEPAFPDNGPTETQKKIYFVKDNNKIKSKKDINRFTSLVALTQSMQNWVAGATKVNSPTNMVFYEPYKTAARTEYQVSTRLTNPSELIILMNVYDKFACEQGISNTSPTGNWNTSLTPLTSKGITIIGEDTIPPGHWMAVSKGMFLLLKLYQATYHLNFEWVVGEQWGGHYWMKFYCNKFMPGVAAIPTSFVPSENYLTEHYNSLKLD